MSNENATMGWAGAHQIQGPSERRSTEQRHSLTRVGKTKMSLFGRFLLLSCLTVHFSCESPPVQMKLNYASAIGTYKSFNKFGHEVLVLNSDSTYVYEITDVSGKTSVDTGCWIGPLIYTPPNWASSWVIGFNDWPTDDELFTQSFRQGRPGYDWPVDRKVKVQFEFRVKRRNSKWCYVIQRSTEQWEYDFVKQD
jgi:hypothetical protein